MLSAIRNYWRSVKQSCRGARFDLSLGVLSFEEHFCLDFFGYYFPLPFLQKWHKQPQDLLDRYGFYWFGDSNEIVIDFGPGKHFRFEMPWAYKHFKSEILMADGTWKENRREYQRSKDVYGTFNFDPSGCWKQHYVYQYTLESGEVQVRTATVTVDRSIHRRKIFSWFPKLYLVRSWINVEFSDEVGERTGSYKGGCLGCGWDLKPGETPEQSLRRMEKERKF